MTAITYKNKPEKQFIVVNDKSQLVNKERPTTSITKNSRFIEKTRSMLTKCSSTDQIGSMKRSIERPTSSNVYTNQS